MSPISLLRVALTVQVLRGLVRFLAPYLGVSIPDPVWLAHPVLGVGIVAAAVWLLRDGREIPASGPRVARPWSEGLPMDYVMSALLRCRAAKCS